jgi:LPXTG-motif cell wall-anchored protein
MIMSTGLQCHSFRPDGLSQQQQQQQQQTDNTEAGTAVGQIKTGNSYSYLLIGAAAVAAAAGAVLWAKRRNAQ